MWAQQTQPSKNLRTHPQSDRQLPEAVLQCSSIPSVFVLSRTHSSAFKNGTFEPPNCCLGGLHLFCSAEKHTSDTRSSVQQSRALQCESHRLVQIMNMNMVDWIEVFDCQSIAFGLVFYLSRSLRKNSTPRPKVWGCEKCLRCAFQNSNLYDRARRVKRLVSTKNC